ncbi:unnamed protein product [Calypogeia fissa]
MAIAAVGTSPMCAAITTRRDEGSLVQRRASRGALQGWRKEDLSWRLEPEVVWFRHFSLQPRKFNTLRLVVAASMQDSQNVDLPPLLPKRRKRPFLIPKKIKKNLPKIFEDPSLKSPANGLLVEDLIPVAHDVMQAKAIATRGVQRLLEELPIFACRYCTETHIGLVGHDMRTCQGPSSALRYSAHDWVKGTIHDVLVPQEAYHLADRLARPVSHEQRFDVDRIDAVEELCIQAGVDVPEYPTKRYTEPVEPTTKSKQHDARWLGGVQFTFYTNEGSYMYTEPPKHLGLKKGARVGPNKGINRQVDDSEELKNGQQQKKENRLGQDDVVHKKFDDSSAFKTELIEPLVDISSEDDLKTVALKTLQAWQRMREGCKTLMIKYRVLACGYCTEIHVGPRGHKGKACGAFKHQWRDGKHGWQDASLDDLIPPQYVWHVRDRLGPPLAHALRRYFGKAPAVVELCLQAGAPVPENHAPLMRLDIAIPTLEEIENVI